jgi:type VI secretion system protein ImpM
MSDEDIPGWHGKLPTLGDFAARRLPHEFIEPWDGWLAAGLATLRASAPEAWLEGYLASPIWRFVLLPGALPAPCAAQGWAGVLMPSVDRAGRYFPFTVARPLAGLPKDSASLTALHRWLRQMDGGRALQDDWTVTQLEAELNACARALAASAQRDPPACPPASVAPADCPAAGVTALITEDASGSGRLRRGAGPVVVRTRNTGRPHRLVTTAGRLPFVAGGRGPRSRPTLGQPPNP